MTTPELRFDGPDRALLTVALAHGAGAPMDSPFMEWFAHGLATQGLRVARFEFPYMAERRRTGVRKPPNGQGVLLDTWRAVIARFGPETLVVGGKSLGGRIASMVADEGGVRGLVCLGYPFHPPGKPAGGRIEHLRDLATSTLVCQGERDPFGARDEVGGYDLSPRIALHWLPDGDHGFAPRKASGRTEEQNWREALEAILGFVRAL